MKDRKIAKLIQHHCLYWEVENAVLGFIMDQRVHAIPDDELASSHCLWVDKCYPWANELHVLGEHGSTDVDRRWRNYKVLSNATCCWFNDLVSEHCVLTSNDRMDTTNANEAIVMRFPISIRSGDVGNGQ